MFFKYCFEKLTIDDKNTYLRIPVDNFFAADMINIRGYSPPGNYDKVMSVTTSLIIVN